MTTAQLEATRPEAAKVIGEILERQSAGEEADADELRLLALEIIMYDPELAKRLVRAGVQKVLEESPTASG